MLKSFLSGSLLKTEFFGEELPTENYFLTTCFSKTKLDPWRSLTTEVESLLLSSTE